MVSAQVSGPRVLAGTSYQVYKWVPTNVMPGVIQQWTSIPSEGEVEILPVASCYGISLDSGMDHLSRRRLTPYLNP